MKDNLKKIDKILPLDGVNSCFRVVSLHDVAPQIFDWLDLLNMNVVIILTLIVAVAGFNMVSGLLILILDKTALIGILKALGYRNIRLQKLFLYIAAMLHGMEKPVWMVSRSILLVKMQSLRLNYFY